MVLPQTRGLVGRTYWYGLWLPALVFLVGGIFASSGCSSFRWARGSGSASTSAGVPKQLQVAVDGRFDDIPIPAGFRLDTANSFAFQNDYTRVGLLRYAGGTKASEVVDFYKEQMPLYNWVLINVVEYDRSLLNFEKDRQSCIITCEGTMTKTTLSITIGPKSESSVKK